MTDFVEKSRTATHEFTIVAERYPGSFVVEFRPLNPKTGKPWQASHRVTHCADVSPEGWQGRLIAYSSIEQARQAVVWKMGELS